MSGKEREICQLEMDLKNIFVSGLIKVLITKFLSKTRSKTGYGTPPTKNSQEYPSPPGPHVRESRFRNPGKFYL